MYLIVTETVYMYRTCEKAVRTFNNSDNGMLVAKLNFSLHTI